jgi:metal-responsive CopG/Arc/MetJ family transcriptional regulator
MARVNVFLKDDLLDEINREAEEEETNRSSLIQAALEKYLEAKRREREEREEQKGMKEACKRMDRLAAKLGRWDAQGIIRQFRDSNLKGSE